MTIPIDYGVLRLIWWALLGVLLIGFAVMDGFDLGAALLQPFVARTDIEKRMLLNSIGPVWEGNQVWFILGGGAVFAAWPPLYAVSFSGFYLAMFLVLAALILRPVAFTFRSKLEHLGWRRVWDWAFFVSGIVPALIFGVAFGNLFLGVPFRFDDTLRVTYEGGLLGLLNPWALLCGLVSAAMLAMHGGAWLAFKTEGALARRANSAASWAAVTVIVLFSLAGVWLTYGIAGYVIQGAVDPGAPSNPLNKTVVQQAGAWLSNYRAHHLIIAAPALAYLGAALTWLLLRTGRPLTAFVASGFGVAGIVATAGLSLFPFLLPSSLDPRSSLTVWDASSSQTTLFIMLIATLVFLPLVILYTGWIFHVLRGPVTADAIRRDEHVLY
jgi:cytochrome bd ubiquinol oxidase subunit II